MDYYNVFIKKREITKDINFFFNQIKGLICNDIFPKYLIDSRKKIHKTYVFDNFLSKFNNTRLQFINDKIEIEFFVNDGIQHSPTNTEIEKSNVRYYPEFKDYKIDNVVLKIKINLQKSEHKNKMIYEYNDVYTNMRKTISEINKIFIEKIQNIEKTKFIFIHKKLLHLKPSVYEIWNNFLKYLIDITDPKFENTLPKLKDIIKGVNTEKISTIYDIIHEMNFYIKYSHYRQIKINKFINKLYKEILDEQEILYLTSLLSKCFNHEIKNLDEVPDFLENVILHINGHYHFTEVIIDTYVLKIFNLNLKNN